MYYAILVIFIFYWNRSTYFRQAHFWFSWFRRIFSLILDADSWFLILGFFDSVDSEAFSDSWFLIPDSWILWFSWFRGIFRFLILRLILDSWILWFIVFRCFLSILEADSWMLWFSRFRCFFSILEAGF